MILAEIDISLNIFIMEVSMFSAAVNYFFMESVCCIKQPGDCSIVNLYPN